MPFRLCALLCPLYPDFFARICRRLAVPCSRAHSAKPRPSPKPNAGPEFQRCGGRASGTRTQAKPTEKKQARLHRRRSKARAHSYPGGSRRVRSAQKPADGSSCRPNKGRGWRRRSEGRTRRPCRIAFREFRRGFAWRHRATLAQRKRVTTTSAFRGISSSFRGRSRARLTEAVGPALTSFCDPGSSSGSCACSATAVRQALPLRTAARFACASRALPRTAHSRRSGHTTRDARPSVTDKRQ